ncbi:MAG: ATP-binding protein [Boseongicola sp. SB0673_bin_14]|nr:ATP-binding protein [Boseongicola sp. SB0667_bin_21]MYI67480.1 ATP-binding protein [Boseongicola sp. SB0673_bin_14]
MIVRSLKRSLEQALDVQPGVVLLGPRQVGKTTLAQGIAESRDAVYLDMERTADRQVLDEPELYLDDQAGRLVVIDEVQVVPDLFGTLRGQIDRRRKQGHRTGQFLLLGSASRALLHQSSESLAGRVSYHELMPFALPETGVEELSPLWLRGGFPESFLAKSERDSLTWREDFIRTYLERDIPGFGLRIPAESLRRFWTMLAHEQGGLLNAAKLAGNLGVSGQSVARYLDVLVDLMVVRRLPPWHSNAGKRLVKSPKVYIRDPGLAHALLGIETLEDLLGHPVVGGSWEGFCIENLIAAAPRGTEASFCRSSAGAEIDLVLKLPGGALWAIEIKRTTSPKVTRGFHIAAEDLGAEERMLVYAGNREVPGQGSVRAMPLASALKMLTARQRR